MKTIPLREFQRAGAKALGGVRPGAPCVLAGRSQKFVILPLTPENRACLMDLLEGLASQLASPPPDPRPEGNVPCRVLSA